jgi:hypothetical protein
MQLRNAFVCALLLVLSSCGRTALGLAPTSLTGPDANAASPDVGRGQPGPDGRVCRWTGFAPQANYSLAGYAIAAGDVDDDGDVDVVVIAGGNGLGDGRASVYRNRGDGSLLAPMSDDTSIEAMERSKLEPLWTDRVRTADRGALAAGGSPVRACLRL